MRLLVASYAYAPSLGGIETATRLLADAWERAGCSVRILTASAGTSPDEGRVVRQPSLLRVWRELRGADAFIHNNLSLRLAAAWPLRRRPWVTIHQTWLRHPGWPETRAVRWKARALRLGTSVAISQAIAAALPVPADVIPNPCDTALFRAARGRPRDRDVAFLGRLVSDKGADLLLTALARLHAGGRPLHATIAGGGPEDAALRSAAREAGLRDSVDFTGPLDPPAAAAMLARHHLLAVPSRWPEPFGIVALEGLAAGCQVVVARSGGLPEAVGVCGSTFEAGDATSLADALARALDNPPPPPAAVDAHLAGFEPDVIAARHLALLRRLLPRRR